MRIARLAHPRTVAREISQLRSLLRASAHVGGPQTLRSLSADIDCVAHILREPPQPIARSTGRTRLIAFQRLIQMLCAREGRTPYIELARLDALLPSRQTSHWHRVGTLVAGTKNRQRPLGPTLLEADLRRIVANASTTDSPQTSRDRALVALHCFTGLRPEEIIALKWENVLAPPNTSGFYGPVALITRNARELMLPILMPAATHLALYAQECGNDVHHLSGVMFCSHMTGTKALSYRAARNIVQHACLRANLPAMAASELRAACAYWLKAQGLSSHESAKVMGFAKVRTFDRLTARHEALAAQRRVQELTIDGDS